MATQQAGGWVVYRNPADGQSDGTMGVCEPAAIGLLAAAGLGLAVVRRRWRALPG